MSGAGHGYRSDWPVSYWLDMKSSHALCFPKAQFCCAMLVFSQSMLYTSEVSKEVSFRPTSFSSWASPII